MPRIPTATEKQSSVADVPDHGSDADNEAETITQLDVEAELRLLHDLRIVADALKAGWDRIPEHIRSFTAAKTFRKHLPKREATASIIAWCHRFAAMVPHWEADDLTDGILAKWRVVRTGGDGWDNSWLEAGALALNFRPSPEPSRHRLVTALHLLAIEAKGQPFPIPVKRIAKSMAKSDSQAVNIRDALVERRIIAMACADYSYRKGVAQTFTFIAQVQRNGEPEEHTCTDASRDSDG